MREMREHLARSELKLPSQETKRVLVHVKPNARATAMLAYDPAEDSYTVAVKAPPIEGRANAELERFFSKLTKRRWRVKSGLASKTKVLVAV
ncbi:DUF167 domain-containing protein [Candidatus Woesearchaeota archaeon]|nr:MAG: DUF167 domain-containing protein [Candidatus Woesearchaeota archaeon]